MSISVRKNRYLLTFVIGLLLMIAGSIAIRFRGSMVVHAEEDIIPDAKLIFYRQDDIRWAAETLGDSSYTLKKSGCLVSCIASAVTMMNAEKTPFTLNEEFSKQNVYDAEGNILWNNLRETGKYKADVFQEISGELLCQCLKDGKYPIARVRMYGLGSFHYVLIVKAENGEFYCVDPLKDELVSLSKYADRIYAIRCVYPVE